MNVKIAQVGTFVLLIISGVLIWQTTNIYAEMDILRSKIETQETVSKDSDDALKKLNDFIDFTAKNKDVVEKFDLILPSDENKANLLSNLDSLSKANGLSALKISFEDAAKSVPGQSETVADSQDHNSQVIKMSLRGNYISFKNFLAAVEKNLQVVDVTIIDFSVDSGSSKAEDQEKIRIYSFNIELKTYYFKPLKEENIAILLNSGKFRNFTSNDLGFTKEKMFQGLFLQSDQDLNTGVDEIGNQNIF